MPEETKGSYSELKYKDNQIGYALRSKDNIKPVFISPGNLISFKDSLDIAHHCCASHKLPEPTRLADYYSKKLKMKETTAQLGLI